MANDKRVLTDAEKAALREQKIAKQLELEKEATEEIGRRLEAGEITYDDAHGFVDPADAAKLNTPPQAAPDRSAAQITVGRRPGDAKRVDDIQRRKELQKYYNSERKVIVNLSPMYAPYFGKTMPLCLNNCYVYVPVDGYNYELPESFADIVLERRMKQDVIIKRQLGMADYRNNLESSPGQLQFF